MGADLARIVERLAADGERYSEISVERLINGADISRSTFYVYFEDKGALLIAMAEGVVQELLEACRVWWELPDPTEEDIHNALHGIIAVYRAHAAVWGAFVEAASYDPNVRDQFTAVVGQCADGVTEHIREGQKQGFVRSEIDPRRTGLWLTWMTERGLYQLTPDASAAELEKLCRALTGIVWQALYAGA
jgi:AcrR family transcriptional regulator